MLAAEERKYPADKNDLAARHEIEVKDGGFGAQGWKVDGLLGITADLFVIHTEHDVLAVRDALSTAYYGRLGVAVFEDEKRFQEYKQHPNKREINIKDAVALDGLPEVLQQKEQERAQGYLGCASDLLRWVCG